VTFAYTAIRPTIPLRPYLTVFLRNGYRTTTHVMALVDSGSDYCIFPDDLASQLGLDLMKAERRFIHGISGVQQEARLARVSLGVLDPGQDRAFDEVSINCAFCTDFKFGSPLLGQSGFFSNFVTTFHQPKRWFEVEPFEFT
jgi:hypothetical protein